MGIFRSALPVCLPVMWCDCLACAVGEAPSLASSAYPSSTSHSPAPAPSHSPVPATPQAAAPQSGESSGAADDALPASSNRAVKKFGSDMEDCRLAVGASIHRHGPYQERPMSESPSFQAFRDIYRTGLIWQSWKGRAVRVGASTCTRFATCFPCDAEKVYHLRDT